VWGSPIRCTDLKSLLGLFFFQNDFDIANHAVLVQHLLGRRVSPKMLLCDFLLEKICSNIRDRT
jgi:hypothetical protein